MGKCTIEYGTDYTIEYEVDGDVDGNKAFIKSITTQAGTVPQEIFDKEDIADMKFHCLSDFNYRQYEHYIATGETL
jgi:hypothetical protein